MRNVDTIFESSPFSARLPVVLSVESNRVVEKAPGRVDMTASGLHVNRSSALVCNPFAGSFVLISSNKNKD